jgi:hypothetical protein
VRTEASRHLGRISSRLLIRDSQLWSLPDLGICGDMLVVSGGGKGLSCGLERMDKSSFLGVSTYADDRKKPLLHVLTFKPHLLLPKLSSEVPE